MKFSVETWAPEYGIGLDLERLEESTDTVDVEAEVEAADWTPITPPSPQLPECVVFVDGVRRIDVRIWISDGELVRAGVCASVAAGAVRCTRSEAHVVDVAVMRGVYASPSEAAGPIATSHGTYEFVPCASDAPDDVYNGIHEQMTRLETQFGNDDDADLVVFDGPLRGRMNPNGVGFVKTQHVQYLPESQQAVLQKLKAGQRTPVFLIGGRGFTRWSWYLRLPGPKSSPHAGIVRCELAGSGAASEAISRADDVTATLQRYASEPHKDTRAPQNLYPIAGLENRLRHRLGDQQILERAMRIAAST
ncbi:MAG: hypothetical protein OXH78_03180 [Acidimicrobiaceae bacterium]|nr:hypothetical protein [Acidimicrobiaceae bacterium]